MTAAEKVQNSGFEDVVLFDQPSFDDALVGITLDGRAVYDFEKMVVWLVEYQGMTVEEATEWLERNTAEACHRFGSLGPIIIHPVV